MSTLARRFWGFLAVLLTGVLALPGVHPAWAKAHPRIDSITPDRGSQGTTVVVAVASPPGRVAAREEPEGVWLITESEALLSAAPMARSGASLPTNGPLIRIQSPLLDGELTPPFPVEVLFEPRPGGAPVQMETLKITYLKMVEIDVTERFKPHLKETRLFVEKANIPAGRHRLKISIADREGNITAAIFQLTVK